MKLKKKIRMLLFGMMVYFASAAAAQVAVDTSQMDRMGEFAKQWQTQLGPNINRLSSAAQNFIHLGEQWEKIKAAAAAMPQREAGGASVGAPQSQPGLPTQLRLPELLGQPSPELAPGNPASMPNFLTRFSGAVQSETSTAWCGKQVVVGFNDSGSFWEAGGFFPPGGQSFNGFAVSSNSGGTFTDKGFPTVGPKFTFMSGDPVLACSSPSNFFYASLFEDSSVPGPSGFGNSDISISLSTDGGNTFSLPIVAVAKDAFFHFLDKEWMAIDPANPENIFITFTDFDFSNFDGGPGNSCGGPGADIPRTAIEGVTSTDGSMTWGAPKVVREVCGFPFVQGSQVAVDPMTGKVFVAWESFAADFFTREIDIAVSSDGGMTFSVPTEVSSVNPVGDADFFFGLQGFIRDFEFPSLTIGKGKKNAGVLYITWNDGDNRKPDVWQALLQMFGIGDGKYGFSDVFFSSSTNGGATWSSPVTVNKPSAAPVDHYQPGVATDKTGNIAVCFYDRERDPNNFLIDRFCAKSTNGGTKFTNQKITPLQSASVVNQDLLIAFDYQGDYDTVASDATNSEAGFRGGFVNTQKGNQNVLVNKF